MPTRSTIRHIRCYTYEYARSAARFGAHARTYRTTCKTMEQQQRSQPDDYNFSNTLQRVLFSQCATRRLPRRYTLPKRYVKYDTSISIPASVRGRGSVAPLPVAATLTTNERREVKRNEIRFVVCCCCFLLSTNAQRPRQPRQR